MRRQIVRSLKRAAAVISLSEEMAQIYRDTGIAGEKIFVIPNGVDADRFKPNDSWRARHVLGLPKDRKIILCTAHLLEAKGLSDLVRAIGQVPSGAVCAIVGGDMDQGQYRKRLLELAQQCGYGDRVLLIECKSDRKCRCISRRRT